MTLKERKRRAQIIMKELRRLYPNAKPALHYSNEWELVIAVALSAQTTDKQVNKVTEKLFQKYKTLDDYLNADPQEFEDDIKTIGLFRGKAKNVLAAAKILKERFNGVVPRTIEELIQLPGVGRKTANVVLGQAFGIAHGIAVDTHVKRLANIYGLTDNTDPKKIEPDLMKILPKEDWIDITVLMIEYGREHAPARKKDFSEDILMNAIKD